MCLIIHKPAGVKVPRDVIDSALSFNRDGVGIMAAGEVQGKWLRLGGRKIKRRLDAISGEAAVHFRMCTHGDVNTANIHPFSLSDGSFLMHNGVLSQYAPKDKNDPKSDTVGFIEQVVEPMIAQQQGISLVELSSKSMGSALLIMDKLGAITKTGTSWVKHEDCLMSNTYAWDAPHSLRWDDEWYGDYISRKVPTYGATPLRTADTKYTRADDLYERVLDEVLSYEDILTFDCPDVRNASTAFEMNRLLYGTISPAQFIEGANATTLMVLYAQVVKAGYGKPSLRSNVLYLPRQQERLP